MLQIADYLYSGNEVAVGAGLQVTTYPATAALLIKVGGTWYPFVPNWPGGTTNSTGYFTLTLPWPSEQSPATVPWTIAVPSGATYTGNVPEGVTGPVALYDLVTTYGWTPFSAPLVNQTVVTVVGPTGAAGPAGPSLNPRGTYSSGATYAVDDAVVYNSSSYFCIQAGTNHQPNSSPTFWQLLAGQGATGPSGGGMTDPTTTRGDIIYRGGVSPTRLGISSDGQYLTLSGGIPAWANAVKTLNGLAGALTIAGSGPISIGAAGSTVTISSTSMANPMTTTGDLIVSSNNSGTPTRLALGTAYLSPQVNAGATALQYVSTPQSLMTAVGDMLYASSTHVPAKVGIGATGQVLTVSGGLPSWQNASSGFANPMTSVGDVIVGGSAGAAQRLGISSGYYVLGANSGATGLQYWPSLQSVLATTGDIVYASSGRTPANLAIGAAGTALVGGTTPSWGKPYAIGRASGAATYDASSHLTVVGGNVPTISNTATNANGSLSITGDDTCGQFSFVTNASTTASGTQVRITFGTAYSPAPKFVVIFRLGVNGMVQIGASTVTTTGFELNSAQTPGTSVSCTYMYLVIQ